MKARSVKNLIILLGMAIAVLLLVICLTDKVFVSNKWQEHSKNSIQSAFHHPNWTADCAGQLKEVAC